MKYRKLSTVYQRCSVRLGLNYGTVLNFEEKTHVEKLHAVKVTMQKWVGPYSKQVYEF